MLLFFLQYFRNPLTSCEIQRVTAGIYKRKKSWKHMQTANMKQL